jgi:periplasmic divalent cation tolerance protein
MHIVVFVTASSRIEAKKIANGLLKEKLAACVNIIGGLQSLFWWEGKINQAREFLLIIKTRKNLAARLIKKVRSLHSYTVPEIIALPIIVGNKKYLEWIDGATS